MLRGVRLLHSFSDLASRHSRLEQILLDDVRLTEQMLDLVFYTLIVLGSYDQVKHLGSSSLPLLHSALVACTLHLLTGYISTQWQDLVHILLAHPKVDIFMDVAFDAVHVDIMLLHIMFSMLNNDILCNKSSLHASEGIIHYFCQQCEASLQFLLSLCQQKLFRDRLLKNKELCKTGGIFSLARTILKLNAPDCFKDSNSILAAVSRLKARILSILLQLCEAESISYLDEVASSAKSMSLAKSVALEILDLLKSAFRKNANQLGSSLDKSNPRGLVLLNSMRLADIFSDDSNFRSFFMINIVQVLVGILAIPHEDFLSSWCSVNVPMIEEDASVDYEPFTAAGVALASLADGTGSALPTPAILNETNSSCANNFHGVPTVSYVQQRTSYLVKIIANLHCFVPNICEEEERDLFLNKFYECLLKENDSFSLYPSASDSWKASVICKNLGSLSNYAGSLIPNMLNADDVSLLSLFSKKLQALFPQIEGSLIQEPCVKEESTAESKLEDSYPVQDTLGNWGTNVKNPQDSQGDRTDAPPGSGGLDTGGLEETQHAKNDINMKVGNHQNLSCQEADQVTVTSKPRELPENDESDKKKMKSTVPATWNTSRSLRGTEKETQNPETNDMEVEFTKGDPDRASDSGEVFKTADSAKEGNCQDDEKVESTHGEEKQPKKRKRNIMNDSQIMLIEKALLDEPEMQRNAALLQTWADKLSAHGSEVTSSQLKNWLNNRKAKLARAARETRGTLEGESASYQEKPSGSGVSHFDDSPESPVEEIYHMPTRGSSRRSGNAMAGNVQENEKASRGEFLSFTQHCSPMNYPCVRPSSFMPGQLVALSDREGKEIGKGKVFQVEGRWLGRSLEDTGLCIVDITELKIEKWKEVQHPSEAGGMTFEKAAARNGGVMRVAWDAIRISLLPP
ncbi:nodulin homeobox isoform X2 [Dioscorea cayenensis subsp. rotundata]|nr:nodulin homeobox isoform X2 [Dioscorea cayenensis subsp. rotundata]